MRITMLSLALALVGCGGRNANQCGTSSDCDLSTGGMCVSASTGSQWCAYPDPECPAGYRYSDQSVGDGLAGACVVFGDVDAGIDSTPMQHDAQAPLVWGSPSAVANVNSTNDERAPILSANGLELYFWIGFANPPYGDIYSATRGSTNAPFAAPSAITAVNGTDSNENGVLPAHSGLELYVLRASVLMISTRANLASSWGTPVAIGANFIGSNLSLSEDDLTMYLVKRCDTGHHDATGPCLFASTRTAVGQPWSTPTFIEWPGAGTNQWNYAFVSGDGLRILLSNPYSGSAVRATQASRPDTSSAWSAPSVIDALSLESTNTEMSWSDNGREIYFTAKPVSPAVGGYDIYVSVAQ